MSEITQPSWHEYMKQHGTEEYAAWEAAVKPYAERIAALTQQLADMTKERDAAIPLIEALKSDRRGLLGLVRACLEQGTPSGELHLLELANRVVEQRDSAQALLKDAVEVLVDVKRMAIPYQLSQDTPMSRASLSAQLGGVIQAFLSRPEVKAMGGGK